MFIVALTSEGCISAVDCSLNGVCSGHSCLCDLPWHGDDCGQLLELPVSFPQGYGQDPRLTSWGASVVSGEQETYHMFVSTMTNNCSLAHWQTNSRVDHAVSENATGPYSWRDVAINTWAHNPQILRLDTNTWALIHIGQGNGSPNGGDICSNEIPSMGLYSSSLLSCCL